MLGNAFSPWHLLIILAVILLLFGAAKLPALAKSVGQSARLFRGEIKAMKEDDATVADPATTTVNNTAVDPVVSPIAPANPASSAPSGDPKP